MTTRLPEQALIEALLKSPRLPAVAERIDARLRYELAIKAQTGDLPSFAVPGFVIPICAIFTEEINRSAPLDLPPRIGYPVSSLTH